MARRIITPFGENGDRTVIPDDAQASGLINYDEGYGSQYSLDPDTDPGARRLNRNRFNQLHHDSTSNIQEWQDQFAPDFVTAAANGGTAVSYPLGMIVWDGTGYRRSLVASNTTDVASASWEDYDFAIPDVPGEDSIATAWVNFDGTGTPTIRDSLNVSSITDNGVGNYTVNFATTTSNANYAVAASSGDANNIVYVTTTRNYTTSGFVIEVARGDTNANADIDFISAVIFGGN